jgi:hypothetical protein
VPIYRFVVDVHTDDAPDGRKMESMAEDLRDYLKAVLCKQYEVTFDKETYGEGIPRWAHLHDSRSPMCNAESGEDADCRYCHGHATDELSRPIEVNA